MNYKTLKELVAIFNSLPGFESYGYANETVTDYKRDEDGKIKEIIFPCGYLKRTTANSQDLVISRDIHKHETWVLGYDSNIVGVFIVE